MLRRLKDTVSDGAPLIQLPPRTLEIIKCDFDDGEREFYASLEAKTNLTMNKYLKEGEVMRNYTEVMVLILRLRQGEANRLPGCQVALLTLIALQPATILFWYQRTSERTSLRLTGGCPENRCRMMMMIVTIVTVVIAWQTFFRSWVLKK